MFSLSLVAPASKKYEIFLHWDSLGTVLRLDSFFLFAVKFAGWEASKLECWCRSGICIVEAIEREK